MREIKFRAWDKHNKTMHPDCYYGGDQKGVNEIIAMFAEDMVWMQYTGLKDKNGKEIYEGDIVSDGNPQNNHCLSGTNEVKFINGAFFPFAIPGWEGTMTANKCEVIGNIYEHSHLLDKNS